MRQRRARAWQTWVWVALTLLSPAGLRAAEDPPLASTDIVGFIRGRELLIVHGDGTALRHLYRTQGSLGRPAGCPDGSLIAFEGYDESISAQVIWTVNVETAAPRRLIPGARMPSWSPDGGRLLCMLLGRRGSSIGLANRDGTGLTRITDSQGPTESCPCWSPDGSRIAFARELHDGKGGHTIVLRDGAGVETTLCMAAGTVLSMNWAPGPDLVFTAMVGTKYQMFTLKPEISLPRRLTDGAGGEATPSWLPDGKTLLFSSIGLDSKTRVVTRRLDGISHAVPGLELDDGEATVVPGPSKRAPQVWLNGRRSYFLPCARLVAGDVLLPAPDLAKALGLTLTKEPTGVTLAKGERQARLTDAKPELETGGETRKLDAAPQTVGGVLMLPAVALAKLFAVTVDYNADARVLRLGGNE